MEQVLDNSEVVEFECGDEDLNDFINKRCWELS